MLTATARYITGNVTEQGRFAYSNLSETGEYAPTAAFSGTWSMSGGTLGLEINSFGICGIIAGGGYLFNSSSAWSTSGLAVVGGNTIRKQVPLVPALPVTRTFSLVDASLKFKLEQQP